MSIEQALPRLLTYENTTQAHSQRHQQWAPSWFCCIGLKCTWWEIWKRLHEHVLFNIRTLLPSNFPVPRIPDLHIPRGWGTIEMLIPSILLTMYCIAHHTMPQIHRGLLEAKPGLPTWVGCWMRCVGVSYGPILASHAPISCMHACSVHNYAKEHKAWSAVNVKDTTFPQGISSSFMIFDINTCCTVSSTRYAFCCHTRSREEFNELEILSPRNGWTDYRLILWFGFHQVSHDFPIIGIWIHMNMEFLKLQGSNDSLWGPHAHARISRDPIPDDQ